MERYNLLMAYLSQNVCNEDFNRVIAEACQRYAKETLGRDKAIAEELAIVLQSNST